jgi:hypothetical protein
MDVPLQSSKKEHHHGGAVRQAQRHGYGINSRPPQQPLHNGLVEVAYE